MLVLIPGRIDQRDVRSGRRIAASGKLSRWAECILGCSNCGAILDRRRSAKNVLMRTETRPIVGLEHPIGKRIMHGKGEVRFDFIPRYVAIRANIFGRTRCMGLANGLRSVEAIHLAVCVFGLEGAMLVVDAERRGQELWL